MTYSPGDEEREERARPDSRAIWMRGLIMLVLLFCLGVAQTVLFALAGVQFVWMLVKGERNPLVADFGRSLGLWHAECTWFLSGDSEERPFPWKPWPRG